MNDELQKYINTGFSPEQIIEMYQNLTNTFDLLSRLTSGDYSMILDAMDDARDWIQGYLSYCKKEYN